MVTVDLSGDFSTEYWAGDHALLFAQTSAERHAEKLPVAIAPSKRLVRHDRKLERMEDWAPN
ncbi:hypothetical protein [Curtobacterium sp. MCBD17_030]|uniref:hypothetical protein n=1 Tax=Curtobacterium sp. MCBD17_030 TaxID=2175649 RepID=UPI000D917892|nr:hypothetical protein [Curtobacterium sp. MCBD17_030]PYY31519.1 hypothetical protein DEI89_16980 [Curtobacterium sp. MCBD17_030]